MKTREDIESYLLRMGVGNEEIGANLWRLRLEGIENLMVSVAGPVVVFRLKLMDIPRTRREQLFEELLRLNTTELFHCAFGIENQAIVLGGALELENMDFNEFQAVIDDMGMAVSKHYPVLSKYRNPS
ncbi:MAG: YbjN domain-containing protein [Polyangia bacterium]|jgi:hypothetical protein